MKVIYQLYIIYIYLGYISQHNFANVSIDVMPLHRIADSKSVTIFQLDEYWLFSLHNIYTNLSVYGASMLKLLLTVAQLIKLLGNYFQDISREFKSGFDRETCNIILVPDSRKLCVYVSKFIFPYAKKSSFLTDLQRILWPTPRHPHKSLPISRKSLRNHLISFFYWVNIVVEVFFFLIFGFLILHIGKNKWKNEVSFWPLFKAFLNLRKCLIDSTNTWISIQSLAFFPVFPLFLDP